MRLGMDKYLPKYKQGEEGLIVNISSITGLHGLPNCPVYSATKHAILGMVKSWGDPKIYNEMKVRVVGICPGGTVTPMFENAREKSFGGIYEKLCQESLDVISTQE